MSEFIAAARVLITPDTTTFRARLQEQVNRAIAQTQVAPLQIPLAFGAGQGIAAAAAATSALGNAQRTTTATTTDLVTAARLENTTFGRQAVILEAASSATLQKAGADGIAGAAAKSHAVAQGQVGKAAVASTAGMLGLRGAVLTAGTAFIAATVGFQALGKAIGSAISFERELNVFQATVGATADEMERVTAISRELGRDITLPGVAANDAAQALSQLARAGLGVEDSINALRGTLQLATAAQIDNAAAAELVANAVNSFKLAGTDATKVADLLAGAANESQGSITDMGLALKQTASIASGLGISIEDTVTILTQLSRAGLSASDAGTSFRQTLLRLIQDLPRVDKEVTALGLHLRDSFGNIRPQVFEELGQKLRKLTPAARQLAVANLGGADAIRTLLILTRAQAGEFDNIERSITRVGIAQELAAARTKGLGGDVEGAKNQFADLGLTVGKVASGPLSLFVRTASQAAGAINDVAASAERSNSAGIFSEFGKVVNDLAGSFGRLNISFQEGVRIAQSARGSFISLNTALGGTADILVRMKNDFDGAISRLKELMAAGAAQGGSAGGPASGLGVKQILNRVTGFDAEEVRARIRGDSDSILSVLESERQFLLDQIDRRFVRNRPALRRSLESALFGVTTDIAAITQRGSTDAKSAADDAARAVNEADQALLNALSQRRDDAERKIAAAAETDSLRDDIRRQNELQALIKIQIAKIRAQVKSQQERKNAIRELRIALIESRREEEALRAQRAQEVAAAQQESINLDISFAQTTNNISREVTARQKLITLLKKQQSHVRKGTLEWKRLRNEIAEQQAAIAEARKQAQDTSKTGQTAQQAFFNFLQTQQGFASNLLGNLIPGFATKGLVGGSTPQASQAAFQTGPRVQQEAAVAGSKTGTVRPVQVDTTNQLLRQILAALRGRHTTPPEVAHNWREAGARFDTLGGV